MKFTFSHDVRWKSGGLRLLGNDGGIGAMMLCFVVLCLLVFPSSSAQASSQAHALGAKQQPQIKTYRQWIKQMKKAPRGPFKRIRWFCHDGSILPPKSYACGSHGGGVQHGQWTTEVVVMRKAGYKVANLLVTLKPGDYVGSSPDLEGLKQVLLERFLLAADDGWIFRKAMSYRGAFQVEDEERMAEKILLAMLGDKGWLAAPRFGLLREAVRLFPQKMNTPSASKVRLLSKQLHESGDPGFAALRAKIHGAPSYEDAAKVRAYAKKHGKSRFQKKYAELARLIDALYSPKNVHQLLEKTFSKVEDAALKEALHKSEGLLAKGKSRSERLLGTSQMLRAIRDRLPQQKSAEQRLSLLHLGLALERNVFVLGSALVRQLDQSSRRQKLGWLHDSSEALYGIGLLSKRQMQAIQGSVQRLASDDALQVQDYRQAIQYLSRAPGWADRNLAFLFAATQAHWVPIEPMVDFYPHDRLRGSPMFFYSAVLNSLSLDANHLAQLEHGIFGQKVGVGLRALNPGLARGILREPDAKGRITDKDGIYLLPETIADLPPVKGILTLGEGNALSHVQLLARNLGIPNVVVGNGWLPEVKKNLGAQVVLAVSQDGVVKLEADSPQWDRYFGEKREEADPSDFQIKPDLEKLDLNVREMIPLSQLRAKDSGRLSGPKSANLGELRHRFGEAVPDGFVISFGIFREFLDQPLTPGGPRIFDWMKENYAAIAALPEDTPERSQKVKHFLAQLQNRIKKGEVGKRFRSKLRAALEKTFGRDGSYGVFIRSDTNVEDLPGFTGAGLNETIANVVGFEKILKAVKRVWASPFTERAYAWRQSHMDQPEYVFPAVLVQYSFPSEKSGVMVTKDVEWGEPGWISVAVNEGIGGAVDGQASESLRIHLDRGEVQFLSQGSAPLRRQLSLESGLVSVPASGADHILQQEEIQQLIQLAQEIPEKFPSLKDAQGNPSTADVEFAFRHGRLALLQIRPLVEAKITRRMGLSSATDAARLKEAANQHVSLDNTTP